MWALLEKFWNWLNEVDDDVHPQPTYYVPTPPKPDPKQIIQPKKLKPPVLDSALWSDFVPGKSYITSKCKAVLLDGNILWLPAPIRVSRKNARNKTGHFLYVPKLGAWFWAPYSLKTHYSSNEISWATSYDGAAQVADELVPDDVKDHAFAFWIKKNA